MKNSKLFVLTSILASSALTQAPAVQAAPTPTPTLPSGDVKTNSTIPLDGQTVVYQGVTYTLSGSAHVAFSVKRQSGGAQIKLHINAQGVSVTAPDGTTYRLVGAGNAQARTEADGATFKANANFGLARAMVR
jgi:hypothetical protein